jgi:3-oxoadipate enol-lactonase
MMNQTNRNEVAYHELDMMVGSARVTARVTGDGPPLVLFHSLLADNTSFDPVAALLAATHKVILLDLPGFGGSDPVEGSLEDVADRVGKALQQMELKPAPVFIGNGYGGFVALLTAIRFRGLAQRLVLADCGAVFTEAGRAAFRGMSAAAEKNGLAGVANVAMLRLFSAEFQQANPDLIATRRERFLQTNIETFHAACAELATLDLRPQLSALDVPVLVLVGEFDEATPPPMSRELAAGLPNARFKVLAGCAHVPQLQEPKRFHDEIIDFISGQS